MQSQKSTQVSLPFWQQFAIAEMVIFSGVALLCKLSGELSRTTYANGLFLASIVVLGIGAFAALSTRSRGDSLSRYLENINPDQLKERVEHTRAIGDAIGGLTMKIVIIGIVPLVASIYLALVPA